LIAKSRSSGVELTGLKFFTVAPQRVRSIRYESVSSITSAGNWGLVSTSPPMPAKRSRPK
jgi:hypothetical protein